MITHIRYPTLLLMRAAAASFAASTIAAYVHAHWTYVSGTIVNALNVLPR